ncbi:hypothetical protein ACQR35_06700 [Pseudarthrobacter sp. J1738]|uniref:hypothetical protein n=1 Tax=Pseudarthrobacter sp. J1738 TaxID=3420446 RepID=UPI003D29A7E3
MVRRANELRPGIHDHAILITPNGNEVGISSSEALKYRQGNRLAVVTGRHSDLGSFNQSFHEIVGLNYPEDARGEASLESFSEVAIDEVVSAAEVTADGFFNSGKAAELLHECLLILIDVHRDLHQGTESWNVYWFRHVDKGLRHLVEQLKLAEALSLDEFFRDYIYACFGLPRPPQNDAEKFSPSQVVEAFQTNWSDSATISTTVKMLEHHPDAGGRPHPLAQVDWMNFDQVLASTDNYCLAFVDYDTNSPGFMSGLRHLTYDQFVSPLQKEEQTTLLPTDATGRPLEVSADPKSRSPRLALSTLDSDQRVMKSELLRIRIPVLRKLTAREVDSSQVNLKSTTPKVTWEGSISLDSNGVLWAIGSVARTLRKAPWKADPLVTKLGIFVPKGDALEGVISPDASTEVYQIVPSGSGMWAFAVKPSGVLGRARYWGASFLPPDSDSSLTNTTAVTLDASSHRVLYVIWTDDSELVPSYEGIEFESLNGRTGLFVLETVATNIGIIEIGESKYECRSSVSNKASHSPVVAAISKMRATIDPLDKEALASVRGIYEEYAVRNLAEASWLDALGHVVVPEDRDFDLLPSGAPSHGSVIMSDDLRGIWDTVSDYEVPEELSQSPEAKEFRDAFANLDVPKLTELRGTGSEDARSLPSKTSWRALWGGQRSGLERYLRAYSELIRLARKIADPAGLFWATYPMSISVWETQSTAECSAVLLSPLHPIRLAWLAGVESVLWDSLLAQSLAGTIEGWNLPLFGPREAEGGRLIAVPVDLGQDQVFMGWSVLVKASTENPRPLKAPERAGKLAVPGTAASGLNATAVSAALRSFRHMNPQISTLTIDLAAVAATNRLPEVDEAVLSAVESWTVKAKYPLIGGARIFDSINRSGEPPQERLSRMVRASATTPLTWMRYFADSGALKKCNIRILQDAGVRVSVKADRGSSRLGVMGPVPLRRFEAGIRSSGRKNESVSSPTFREDQGWEPFSAALRECEGGPTPATITTKLFQANLVSDTADWTVSGEALMNPSAMAAIVHDASGGQQMLWEWRPPFLDKAAGIPALERRPFVSIARVPHGFRKQIGALLERATGKDTDDEAVDRLLGTLGSRGVGLSSMLSMGGTHAAGALGFYLVFALMEHCQAEGTYVLPIDACDSFLRALADGADHAELTQRADLLIVRVDDGRVTLAPIEIKFYGLGAELAYGSLPVEGDAALKDPLGQINSTQRLLKNIAEVWDDLQSPERESDRALWANGFTALIEAAVKLQPRTAREPEVLARSLAKLVNGDMKLNIGRPIIAYFKHDAFTATGAPYHVWSGNVGMDHQVPEFSLVSANAATAFDSALSAESKLVVEWRGIVEQSLSRPASCPGGEDFGDGRDSKNSAAVTAQQAESNKSENGEGGENVDKATHHGLDATGVASPNQVNPRPSLTDIAWPAVPNAVPSLERARGRRAKPVEGHPGRERAPFTGGVVGEGVRFPVGRLLGATSESFADFWPSNTDLNQMNVGIVGDLGTGKTQLMKALVLQLRRGAERAQETPLSMLILDYKRDFQERDFLDAVGGTVLNINNIPLNFFQLRQGYSPMAANQRANEFIDVLDKIYGGIGPVQKDRLSMTITDLYRENQATPPTLGRILERYSEDQRVDAVTSIIRKFVSSEIFSESPESFQSFSTLMNNRVLVLPLNEFGTDDDGKNALVVMFLNMYYDYMLSANKWPYVGEKPQLRRLNSFLLVDEAVNIMKYKFPVLMNLLLQGREFGFGVMLASQYLSHFKKDQENYGEPLLTWFIHKVKTASPRELTQLGLGDAAPAVAQTVTHLDKHQALYSSLGFRGKFIEDIPFFRLLAEEE